MDELTVTRTSAPGRSGELRLAISNAVVGLWKRHYGRGPTAARVFIDGPYVFVVLQEGLTRGEETLLAAGQTEAVRDMRRGFAEAIDAVMRAEIEQVTGRRVMAHECQMALEPATTFEIFVLDGPPELDGTD